MTHEATPILFLSTLAAIPVLWALLIWPRKSFTLGQWTVYLLMVPIVRLLWRGELPSQTQFPPGKGAVIICNHRSSLDGFILQIAIGRQLIHWMVAQLYNQKSLIGWLLALCGTIPVAKRGRDVSSTKAAIHLASGGKLVGMLPEGTINTSDEFMLNVRPGAILVALKARVPILPCYIEGAPFHDTLWKPLFMPSRVTVKVGQFIDLSEYFGRESDKAAVAKLTLRCVKEIAKLAGRDDFEPQLAGRNWKTWASQDSSTIVA